MERRKSNKGDGSTERVTAREARTTRRGGRGYGWREWLAAELRNERRGHIYIVTLGDRQAIRRVMTMPPLPGE